ncbi:MAG: nucleotide-binding protein [Saccharothrix sp.]|nr:nucleotide-binding protein [Saccharothrix sp.]
MDNGFAPTSSLGLHEDRARNVFVVHGRNKAARRAVYDFLRTLRLHPLEWSQALDLVGTGAPPVGEVFDKGMSLCRAVLVLMTPDDVVRLKPEFLDGEDDPERAEMGQARPNVLFEAGFALARYPERTLLVQFGKVRPFTDIGGLYVFRLTDHPKARNALARGLERVGCTVDRSGQDWLSGDLTPPSDHRTTPRPPVNGVSRPGVTSGPLRLGNTNVIVRHGRHVVHGEATNPGQRPVSAAVRATFYDADGAILGSANGFVSDVGPGETKTYELMSYDTVAGYSTVRPEVAYEL